MIENTIELVGELTSTGELVGQVATGTSVGTTNYERLNNKPKINGIELLGNMTLDSLGITNPEIPTNVSAFNNDAGYLTEVPSGYVTEETMNNTLAEKNDNPVLEFYFGDYDTFPGVDSNGSGKIMGPESDETILYSDLLPILDILINNFINSKGGMLYTKSYYEQQLMFKVTSAYTSNPDNASAYLKTIKPWTTQDRYCGLDTNKLYDATIEVKGTYSEINGFTSTYFKVKTSSSKCITMNEIDTKGYATEEFVNTAINEAIGAALEASY